MQRIFSLAGLIVIFSVAAWAQSTRTVPCVVDVGTTAAGGKHVADWQPRPAEKGIFEIAPGTEIVIPFSMPADGVCIGRFTAFDDREEMALKYTTESGKAVTKQPKGDVEFLILDAAGMASRKKDDKYTAKYSGGTLTDGEFTAQLPAGDYFVIVSNKHSDTIPKKVLFWFGRSDEEK